MSLLFDARELGNPVRSYVAWVDVMGIQSALRSSISIAANFVYKMHDAALQSTTEAVRVYPVMDGVYACAETGPEMERFLRAVFRAAAGEFVATKKNKFRFVVKGSVACGEVYHGADLRPAANPRLRDHPSYRDNILLGIPMVAAHLGESEAPPYGVFADASARHFASTEPFPFDLWWRWYEANDSTLVRDLNQALGDYYDWCWKEHESIKYPRSRVRLHRGQAALYLR